MVIKTSLKYKFKPLKAISSTFVRMWMNSTNLVKVRDILLDKNVSQLVK